MTIRNLDRILAPRRVAVIGASGRQRAVGHLVLANMRAGGFSGTLMPVNPRETEIDGLRVYPDVDALPEDPDLAVIATPPDTVPGLIANWRARLRRRGGHHRRIWRRRRRGRRCNAARPCWMPRGPRCCGSSGPIAWV